MNKKTSFFLDFSDRQQDDQALVKATIFGPDFLPQPLTENVPTPNSRISVSPRIDYQLGSKITLQARYTLTRATQDNSGVGGFNLPAEGINNETTTQSAQLTATWVVNPQAINESRFQYTRSAKFPDCDRRCSHHQRERILHRQRRRARDRNSLTRALTNCRTIPR